MARIVYSITGEGMGHVVRSSVIIRELQKKHKVKIVVSSRRGYEVLKREFKDVTAIIGPPIQYRDNTVDDIDTARKFLNIVFRHSKDNFTTLYTLVKRFKPVIIITDFENAITVVSTLLRIPSICLCNVHAVTHLKYRVPAKYARDYHKARIIVGLWCTNIDYHLITTFFYEPVRFQNTFLYPPVLRKEIIVAKTATKEYILVYQTSSTNTKLIRALQKIDEKFIVYGFNKEAVEDHITYRKFNQDRFFKEFRECKACIANGGFTFVSEAISLHKPILCIPIKGQFEQILNALEIKRLGYGDIQDSATHAGITRFIARIEQYAARLATYNPEGNARIIEKIEEIISSETHKNK